MVNQQQDQNSGTNWQDEARRQASMYPNLEEFLNQMMPEIQSDFLREFFNQPNNHNAGSGSTTSNAPPTAPPAQENSEENGANNSRNASGWNWQNWSDNWHKYHAQQQQQRPNNFQNNERTAPPEQENSEENGANNSRNAGNTSGRNWQNWSDNWQKYHAEQQQQRPNNFQNNERSEIFNEDDVSILLQRIGKKVTENFAKAIGFVAFMLPILIVPKYFLALGIFAAFMKSFGVSLTPLVIGGILYEIITSLDPILLTLLGIWTIWKVLILRLPLVDINYWKHRMGVRCCSRRSSN